MDENLRPGGSGDTSDDPAAGRVLVALVRCRSCGHALDRSTMLLWPDGCLTGICSVCLRAVVVAAS